MEIFKDNIGILGLTLNGKKSPSSKCNEGGG